MENLLEVLRVLNYDKLLRSNLKREHLAEDNSAMKKERNRNKRAGSVRKDYDV